MLKYISDSLKPIIEDFKDGDISYVLMTCALLGAIILLVALAIILVLVFPYFINFYLGLGVSLLFLLPFVVMVYVRYFKK